MKVTPVSSAAFSAASASLSLTSPQVPPIAQAPKPISDTAVPSRDARLCFIVVVRLN